MENILPELITVGSGLAILGVSYLTSLLAALANVFGSHTEDTFSWKKLGRGLAKAGIWALAVVSFTLVMNLLMWFSSRVDLNIEGILKDTNVIGLIGIVLTASATYINNAYDNIKFFLLKGGESQVDTSNANPDYQGILDDTKKLADKITPHWTANEKQTCEEAEEIVEDIEVGQGASVNPLSRRLPDGTWYGQCSRYAYYLGTGIEMNYAPHPDYGPCDGQNMTQYLIDNYGFVRCGKIAGAIFDYPSGEYGHCGMVVDPASNTVNDANWQPLVVSTHYLNLDAVGARYCCPPDMLPPEPTPTPEPTPAPSGFNVGDTVTLTNWVDYNGTPLAQTRDYYFISELDGDRAVLRADSIDGAVYAAVNTRNLEKVNAPAPQPEPDNSFHVGDVVVPTVLVDYYGTELYQFDDTYTIIELNGDRAVLSARGQVWAAMNTSNIRHA